MIDVEIYFPLRVTIDSRLKPRMRFLRCVLIKGHAGKELVTEANVEHEFEWLKFGRVEKVIFEFSVDMCHMPC